MPYVEKLKLIKDERNLSLADIARVGDIPLATVTRVFNGQTPNPTFETITRIAIGMGVSLDVLAGLKHPDAPQVASPIENALNTSADLLSEKDKWIAKLTAGIERERKEKHMIMLMLFILVAFVITVFTVDILNGHFGYFQH